MSDFGQTVGAGAGDLGVVISKMGAHPPEFYADRIVEKLMYVSADAAQPIRDQALAFRQQMHEVVLYYVKQAMKSAKSEARIFDGD